MSPADYFLRSGAWPVLLLAPATLLALLLLLRARGRRLARVVGPRSTALTRGVSVRARRLHISMFALALLLALLAGLGPVWGEDARALEQAGIDILVCLDVSRSMLARDVDPSRLEAARSEIVRLAERAAGDRLGLVVFAGEARLAVPLTRDRKTFAELAQRADPLSVLRGGTDLGAALGTALDALKGRSARHAVVVLVTDGDDLEGNGARVARDLRDRGITVHCLGLGTDLGAKIPDDGGSGFVRDGSGREVVVRLHSDSLRELASGAGGKFVGVTSGSEALVNWYESSVVPMAREQIAGSGHGERKTRYQWPLLAALLIWNLKLCLIERRR